MHAADLVCDSGLAKAGISLEEWKFRLLQNVNCCLQTALEELAGQGALTRGVPKSAPWHGPGAQLHSLLQGSEEDGSAIQHNEPSTLCEAAIALSRDHCDPVPDPGVVEEEISEKKQIEAAPDAIEKLDGNENMEWDPLKDDACAPNDAKENVEERGTLDQCLTKSGTNNSEPEYVSRVSSEKVLARVSSASGKSFVSRKRQDTARMADALQRGHSEDSGGARAKAAVDLDIMRRHRFQRWAIIVVDTVAFEMATAFAMITNLVVIGILTDLAAERLGSDPPFFYSISQHVYCVIFVCEALLRLLAAGPRQYVCGSDRLWNFIDVTAATMSVFESLAATLAVDAGQQFGVIRMVRAVRLIRVFRIIRVLRFVSALKSLVTSIVGTMKSLIWTIVLLAVIIYGASLVFTQAATQEREDAVGRNREDDPNMLQMGISEMEALDIYWGNLGRSMLTLFMSTANGLDWEVAYRALQRIGHVWGYMYFAFIAFTYFAVVNVVTANFCQAAMESAHSDQDVIMSSVLKQKNAYSALLKRLFKQIDINGTGQIRLKELDDIFQQEEVQTFFSSLELEPVDAWSLFKLLDSEGVHSIDVEEFVEGCMRLRGQAKQIEVVQLMDEHEWLMQAMTDFMNHMDDEMNLVKKGIGLHTEETSMHVNRRPKGRKPHRAVPRNRQIS